MTAGEDADETRKRVEGIKKNEIKDQKIKELITKVEGRVLTLGETLQSRVGCGMKEGRSVANRRLEKTSLLEGTDARATVSRDPGWRERNLLER